VNKQQQNRGKNTTKIIIKDEGSGKRTFNAAYAANRLENFNRPFKIHARQRAHHKVKRSGAVQRQGR